MIAKMIRERFIARKEEPKKTGIVVVGMTPKPEPEEQDPVMAANADIKNRLNNFIIDAEYRHNIRVAGMKQAIEDAERTRIADEVKELLAEEQRKTSMGDWA